MYQTLVSKYIKNKIIEEDPILKEHIPEYLPYNRKNLKTILEKYGVAYVKKDGGGGGAVGVFKVEYSQKDGVEDRKSCVVTNANGEKLNLLFTRLPDWVQPFHFVQQGIVSYGHEGRSLEMRVYLQKLNEGGVLAWKVIGAIPKVAREDTFSPTLWRGARAFFFEEIFPGEEDFLKYVHDFCLRGSNVLGSNFTGLRELGFDIGIDKDKKLWIFEINTKPVSTTFEPLDKDLYKKLNTTKKWLERTTKTQEFSFSQLKSRCKKCR